MISVEVGTFEFGSTSIHGLVYTDEIIFQRLSFLRKNMKSTNATIIHIFKMCSVSGNHKRNMASSSYRFFVKLTAPRIY
jgi:hypothetical protein